MTENDPFRACPRAEVPTERETVAQMGPEFLPEQQAENREQPPKRRLGWKIFLAVLLALLLLAGAVVLYLNCAADRLLENIKSETFKEAIETETPELLRSVPEVDEKKRKSFEIPLAKEEGIRNILLIGSDAREGENIGRSDAMILLTINDESDKIHLTSLMRAIYVSIPEDPDPEMAEYWRPNSLLNAAHTWGGPRLLLKTIQRNFRVNVKDYIEVDFSGFQKVIDTLGGVELELTEQEAMHLNSSYAGWNMRAGKQYLNGEEALAYSRIRYIDTDFVRTSRQRRILESLFNRFKAVPVAQLTEALQAIFPNLKTNMSRREMKALLMNAGSYARYKVDQLMLPLEGAEAKVYIGSREVYDIDWEKNLKRLHEFMEE